MSYRSRSTPLLLTLLLAGCMDDLGPTSVELENSVYSLLGGLEVGEALTLSGAAADSVFLGSPAEGAEYLYVPFFAAEAGEARLEVEVGGSNLQSFSSAAFRAELPLARPEGPRPDWDFHDAFLARSAGELDGRLQQARSLARASRSGAAARSQLAVPARVGSVVSLNTNPSCDPLTQDVRRGRVEAVGRTVILVADTANPAAGLSRADYEAFAREFDEMVVPTLTRYFGDPTDLDANGRVVVFFTRAVNEMTPPNSGSYVGGFFWAGDLFPRRLCPTSNEAEIFYMLVADEAGEVNGNAFPTEFVRSNSVGTLGHELQHLINAGRRIYVNDAEDFEETWLNEGLSHIAEELMFYAASGLGPGQNVDLPRVRSSDAIRRATNALMYDNLVRYALYLQQPEDESLLGIDNLETRGATWAFLRYVADHDPRSDEELFRLLVNARVSGTESLARVLGADVIDLMQAWTVSVFTDDHALLEAERFQQPSWNFRSVIPALYQNNRFPLRETSLGPDQPVRLRLRGGGAAYVRLRGAPGRPVLLSTTSGGRVPPDRLRVSVLRLR